MSGDVWGCSFPTLGPAPAQAAPSENDPSVCQFFHRDVLAGLDISEVARLLFSVKVSVKI